MKRVIKFRVWDKHFKTLYYPNAAWSFQIHNNGNIFYQTGVDKEDNYIIQQFTGLKDKKGKEIYEGDIIVNKTKKNPWPAGPVVWDGYGWAIRQENPVPIGLADDWSLPAHKNKMRFSQLEIIGNIFENPELI